MGWGSKKTTDTTQSQTQSQTSTPLQQAYASQLQSSLAPHYGALLQEADKPVYGDAQKAGVLNNLNDLANASIKHLSSSLAGRGQLDSGQFTAGASNIEQQRYGQASQFFSQLPAMERSAHMQNTAAALDAANRYAVSVPMGQSSTGNSSGTSDSTETSSPGLSGLIGGLAGMALSGATGGLSGGFASMLGGGSFGQGYQNGMNPGGGMGMPNYGPATMQSSGPFGAQPGWYQPNQYGGY